MSGSMGKNIGFGIKQLHGVSMSSTEKDCGCGSGKVPDGKGNCVMPEVSFTTFIMSLNTSVLFHLGEIADPRTGKKTLDRELARHSIDTLVMLENKSQGNLTEDEKLLLKEILRDVKLRFVNSSK